MNFDPVEIIRRAMLAEGVAPTDDEPTWTTEELRRDFEVFDFSAPFVTVRRRSDGVLGSLKFRHQPRVYFGWKEDTR